MDSAEQVRELVEPVVAASGLEVVDVEVRKGLVRLSVDRPGGVDLDAISAVTPDVSAVLDAHDPVPGHYELEVSSPGLERPLRTPEHFRRFVGSTVSIRTQPGVEGERRLQGTLVSADDEAVVVSPVTGDARRVAYTEIERARTVFEWGPPPRPGHSKPAGRSQRRASTS